jgi:hypothetical protein
MSNFWIGRKDLFWKQKRDETLRYTSPGQFPTLADLNFWNEKHIPSWGRVMHDTREKNRIAPTFRPHPQARIHEAINSHRNAIGNGNSKKREYLVEAGNALVCLRSYRRRLGADALIREMKKAVVEFKDIQPKRSKTYARWLRRWYKANAPKVPTLCSCGWDHEIYQRTYADPFCEIPGHRGRLENDASTVVFHPFARMAR